MKPAHFESYHLIVEPLSPIHVGSGGPIEPYEYDLQPHTRDAQGRVLLGVLTVFDVDRLLAGLSARQQSEFARMTRAMTSKSFPQIRSWLRDQAGPEHQRFRIAVSPHSYNELAPHLDSPERKGEIHLLPRDARDGRVYLPGSSIKGAVRTALVDHFLGAKPHLHRELEGIAREAARRPHDLRPNADFQAAVLGNRNEQQRPDLYRDPLRQLAVGDVGVADKATYIDRITLVRSAGPSADDSARPSGEGVQMHRELLRSQVYGEEVRCIGELRLFPQLNDPQVMVPQKDGRPSVLPEALTAAELCRWCTDFYRPRLDSELDRFAVPQAASDRLRRAVETLTERQALIRLGRHSHVECVTVGDPFRRAAGGGSRSYAPLNDELGRIPLGWARLTLEPRPRSG